MVSWPGNGNKNTEFIYLNVKFDSGYLGGVRDF
jgi:hypothetical protein